MNETTRFVTAQIGALPFSLVAAWLLGLDVACGVQGLLAVYFFTRPQTH
jgi:hypothetical protein